MPDYSHASLEQLIRDVLARRLVDRHHMTEWVVVLYLSDLEIVLNHPQAHVFLQGLLHGADHTTRIMMN